MRKRLILLNSMRWMCRFAVAFERLSRKLVYLCSDAAAGVWENTSFIKTVDVSRDENAHHSPFFFPVSVCVCVCQGDQKQRYNSRASSDTNLTLDRVLPTGTKGEEKTGSFEKTGCAG